MSHLVISALLGLHRKVEVLLNDMSAEPEAYLSFCARDLFQVQLARHPSVLSCGRGRWASELLRSNSVMAGFQYERETDADGAVFEARCLCFGGPRHCSPSPFPGAKIKLTYSYNAY